MFPVIRSSAQWKEVRDKIDLVQVAHEVLGEPEEKSGHTSYWFCPFHGGTEPSLQVVEGRSRWRCPGCHEWGDAVDLVRRVKQVTFSKALEFLSRREFYPDEEGVRPESSVGDGPTGGIAPDESTGVHDHWIDDLLG
jgi:DNA primase